MALTTVNSDGVKNDSIKNIDIKSDAAIEGSKLDNPLQLPDDYKISFGTTGAGDLEIYHSGGNSFIHDGGDGGLYIRGSILGWRDAGNSNASWINTNSGAGVELYYAGTKKFETITGGVNVTGDLGVGTTSPSNWGPSVHLKGVDPCLLLEDSATTVDYYGVNVSAGAVTTWFDDAATFTIGTATALTGSGMSEKVKIDSTGNVGLSTTPKAWDSTNWRSISVGNQRGAISSYHQNSPSLFLTTNSYSTGNGWDSTWKQDQLSTSNGFDPCRYYMYNGEHYFERASTRNDSNDLSFGRQLTLSKDLDVRVNNGNLIIGTVNKGIMFQPEDETVTGPPGSDSNLLDDYEEGSFTPTFASSGGSFTTLTFHNTLGRYVKVGRQVTCWIRIYVNAVDATGASGYVKINGLPYTCSTGTEYDGATLNVNYYTALSNMSNQVPTGYVANGTSYVTMQKNGGSTAGSFPPADLGATNFYAVVTYHASA